MVGISCKSCALKLSKEPMEKFQCNQRLVVRMKIFWYYGVRYAKEMICVDFMIDTWPRR